MVKTPFAGVSVCLLAEGEEEPGRCGRTASLLIVPGMPKAWSEIEAHARSRCSQQEGRQWHLLEASS